MRIRKPTALVALLFAATLAAACESSPSGNDDVTPIVGTWAARGAVRKAAAPSGDSVQVRSVEQWTFNADKTYEHEGWVISAETEALLGYTYRESGTFSLNNNTIVTKRVVLEKRTDDPWSMTLTPTQSPYTSTGFWTVIADRLDLRFTCTEPTSCVLPLPYTRVTGS